MTPTNHVFFTCIRCGGEVTRWRGDELWANPLFSTLCRLDVAKERARVHRMPFTGYPPRGSLGFEAWRGYGP